MLREKISYYCLILMIPIWLPILCCIGCCQAILIKCGCMEDMIERDIRLLKERQEKEKEICESFEHINIDLSNVDKNLGDIEMR